MLRWLTGLGRPLLEGGGINSPSDSLESGELTGVTEVEDMFRQGDESSPLRQKVDEHLWNLCGSWPDILCSGCEGTTERKTLRRRKKARRKGKDTWKLICKKGCFVKIRLCHNNVTKWKHVLQVDFPIVRVLRFSLALFDPFARNYYVFRYLNRILFSSGSERKGLEQGLEQGMRRASELFWRSPQYNEMERETIVIRED